jgi:hypothetical protein
LRAFGRVLVVAEGVVVDELVSVVDVAAVVVDGSSSVDEGPEGTVDDGDSELPEVVVGEAG